jgi:PKD repeat protein
MIAVESLNSDSDSGGFSNLEEINANAQPGWCSGTDSEGRTCTWSDLYGSSLSPPAGVGGDLDPVPGGEPPVADANGPYEGFVGQPVLFDASGSTDPDGNQTIASYTWNFGDGSPEVTVTTDTVEHTYTAEGVYNVSLIVTDDTNLTGSDTTTATIVVEPPPQLPPVADADGPYLGEPGLPVTFDGSGSTDPNGNDTIDSYTWDFGDGGPTVTVSTATVDHTYQNEGVYDVTLVVTDDTNLTSDPATTTATIETIVVELPPVADANGPYQGEVDVPVQFNGTGSTDPNGDDTIVRYDWDFGDGSPIAVDVGPTPTHTYTDPAGGTYNVTLTVYDVTDLSDSDTTTATIGIGPVAPTADANGPYTGTVGIPVTFDASGSTDPNGDIATYEWDFGDGGPKVTVTTPTVEHIYAAEGLYDVSLTVMDETGLSDSDATTADIAPQGEEADVFLTRVRAPSVLNVRSDRETVRTITVFGDGTNIVQDAMVTLTAAVDGVAVVIEPETVTEEVVPGGRETRFSFEATLVCEQPGSSEILWTATIDAPENADTTNDTAEALSEVRCRGTRGNRR